ncbi:hypothetical protein B4119_1442 [Parageobacillus caldoxylosilyticus]|uniref:Uncharacterized protein n=1 Tax=Saccharococcus caldoxylosilyticus TaxID=81408 RepID=A0A150LPQ8_9BACL|nr:hypothetical protein B4119_1442 [Parageobacillus caldoxylosilyticus]
MSIPLLTVTMIIPNPYIMFKYNALLVKVIISTHHMKGRI